MSQKIPNNNNNDNSNDDKNENMLDSENLGSAAAEKNRIYKSERIEDRKSVFIAYAKRVENKQQVESFKDKIEKENNTATHNTLAYRLVKEDDGTIIEG